MNQIANQILSFDTIKDIQKRKEMIVELLQSTFSTHLMEIDQVADLIFDDFHNKENSLLSDDEKKALIRKRIRKIIKNGK